MRSWFAMVGIAVTGCDSFEEQALAPPDEDLVSSVMRTTRPEPLIELVEVWTDLVPVEAHCPLIEVDGPVADDGLQVDGLADGPRHETWTGGCTLSDGTTIEGVVELYDGPDATWVAGDGFVVRSAEGVDLYLDGAIELQEQGDLLLLDASASLCGEPGSSCADGAARLDLLYTIFPLAGYPTQYDATVSGAVDNGDALISVEGTWSIDEDLCADEPASGTFAIAGAERHSVEMDGATRCDDCATWVVAGVDVGPYCGLEI